MALRLTPRFEFRPEALQKDLFGFLVRSVKKLLRVDKNKLDFQFARNLGQNIFNNIQLDVHCIDVELRYDQALLAGGPRRGPSGGARDSFRFSRRDLAKGASSEVAFRLAVQGVSIRTTDRAFQKHIFFNMKDPRNRGRPISKLINFRKMTLEVFRGELRRSAEKVFDFSFKIKVLIHTKRQLAPGEVHYSAKLDVHAFELNFREEFIEYVFDVVSLNERSLTRLPRRQGRLLRPERVFGRLLPPRQGLRRAARRAPRAGAPARPAGVGRESARVCAVARRGQGRVPLPQSGLTRLPSGASSTAGSWQTTSSWARATRARGAD